MKAQSLLYAASGVLLCLLALVPDALGSMAAIPGSEPDPTMSGQRGMRVDETDPLARWIEGLVFVAREGQLEQFFATQATFMHMLNGYLRDSHNRDEEVVFRAIRQLV